MDGSGKAGLPEGGKARRVYLLLREEIAGGRHDAGGLLPGEQRLAEIHGVSRVTVRRALDALEAEGWVERRAGSGTRALPMPGTAPLAADVATLMPQLAEMGRSTEARLLSFAYGPAPETVRAALGLGETSRTQVAVRVRSADGAPFSHLTTHVPEDIARGYSEADLAAAPLLELLERSGVRIEGAHQSVTATLASPDVADALEVAEGSALLALRRVVRDAEGRGVEHLSALYRPDRFRLDMPLVRAGEGAARHWEPRIGAEGAA